jgi:hypothetical protein
LPSGDPVALFWLASSGQDAADDDRSAAVVPTLPGFPNLRRVQHKDGGIELRAFAVLAPDCPKPTARRRVC